jgi:hypothetical protein
MMVTAGVGVDTLFLIFLAAQGRYGDDETGG